MIYEDILNKLKTGKLFAILVDPDKHDEGSLRQLSGFTDDTAIDFILVGGSLVSGSVDETVQGILYGRTAEEQ